MEWLSDVVIPCAIGIGGWIITGLVNRAYKHYDSLKEKENQEELAYREKLEHLDLQINTEMSAYKELNKTLTEQVQKHAAKIETLVECKEQLNVALTKMQHAVTTLEECDERNSDTFKEALEETKQSIDKLEEMVDAFATAKIREGAEFDIKITALQKQVDRLDTRFETHITNSSIHG